MKITCNNCGNTQETDLGFFVQVIGGALPFGGYWAWVTYLFAGTGLAMPIVIAIIGGGVSMLIFKDQIVEWIMDNNYTCSSCGECSWSA
tara:strand:+ start:704 stop:970 length:267 start_codon:yes stop_codon:yes gene_type:complete